MNTTMAPTTMESTIIPATAMDPDMSMPGRTKNAS